MAIPNTRQKLIDYCLRALGHPVIEINVDDDQIEDRVDEAIQFYQDFHSDAVVRNLLKHQVTQTDIDNGYIGISTSANILSINNVFSIDNTNSGTSLLSLDYQMHLNDVFDLNGAFGGIVNYELTQQYLSLIDRNINGAYEMIQYSRHKSRVNFHTNALGELGVGNYVVFDGYSAVDPESFTAVYNDMFLKRYITALVKRQWGLNLIKFEGMVLPGGVTMNGRQIYDDAIADIEKLEEKIRLEHELPPLDFIG
jgi:hypothetical protein|tara:strand:- start:2656 stop:3414 length:759 start_codon:yes stop_codon:yes gene_type:complete